MSIVDTTYRTVICNGPGCDKTVTFNGQDQAAVKELMDSTPWMKTLRVVQQVVGGRNFAYCSDECEIANAGTGAHNPDEPKRVISTPAGAAQIAAAAAAARQAEEATKAMKDGTPVTLHSA